MFDWLFGTKRQTNQDDLNAAESTMQDSQQKAVDYYMNNIQGKDWGAMDTNERNRIAGEYDMLNSNIDPTRSAYEGYKDAFDQEEKATRHDYFGNGILGALLNPIAQTATAGVDLATGNYGDRDVASDLGALGETLLTFLPGVGLVGKAGKVGIGRAHV